MIINSIDQGFYNLHMWKVSKFNSVWFLKYWTLNQIRRECVVHPQLHAISYSRVGYDVTKYFIEIWPRTTQKPYMVYTWKCSQSIHNLKTYRNRWKNDQNRLKNTSIGYKSMKIAYEGPVSTQKDQSAVLILFHSNDDHNSAVWSFCINRVLFQ